jgi:hypothetical protein
MRRLLMARIDFDPEFNHAPNDSPRSGSSKKITPVVWSGIVAALLALGVYFAIWPM